MSSHIKIMVTDGSRRIEYEQSVKETLSIAATVEDGYSKGSSRIQLMQTISDMCEQLKGLKE